MSKEATTAILRRHRLPPALSLILLLELVALGATIPVIAYYVRQLGGSALHVTFCFFLTAAPKVVMQPIWGGLSDRIGRKPVMIFSLAGSLISYVIWAMTPSLTWLLVSRAVFGLFGAQLTIGTSIVADRLEPDLRARGMGILGATAGIGFIIGPVLGGVVAGSTSHAAIGWMNAGLEMAAIVFALAALPETSPRQPGSSILQSGTARLWRVAVAHPSVRLLLLVVLVGTTGLSVIQGTLVVLAEDRWGYDVMQMGKLLSLFFLVGALIQGGGLRPLVPRFGEANLARAGYSMIAAALFLLMPETPVQVLWLSLVLVAVGTALTTPTMTALLSKATHEKDQGKVQGLNQGVTGLGRSLSGATMGGLYDRFGAATPFGISALLVVAALLLLTGVRHEDEASPFRT